MLESPALMRTLYWCPSNLLSSRPNNELHGGFLVKRIRRECVYHAGSFDMSRDKDGPTVIGSDLVPKKAINDNKKKKKKIAVRK